MPAMPHRRRAVLALAAVVALGAAACGGDDATDAAATTTSAEVDADGGAGTTTTTAGAGSTTTVPTATSLGAVPDELPDGRWFGYITSVTPAMDGTTAEFDLAELLTGAAAAEAAEAAGEEPLDFYLKNDNPKLRTVTIAPDAEVRDIDPADCCEPKDVTVADFAAARADGERTPVAITVEDGTVTALEEIYFP